MNGGFRLRQIKVEGFKGFTATQTVPINGNHLFILGPNGYGKSSIVEAIRWGLFGSTRRPGEVVANQGYAGSCKVELLLERGGAEWTLKRTLIRGVSGGSDAEIVEHMGQSHPLREVLPQLESVPAGEGMHIIYAAQSAPLRRPAEDISPFERTIYSYLGLTDVRVAVSGLENFIEESLETTEKDLAEKVGEKRNSIERELDQMTQQRNAIIGNPPWGGGRVPTQAQTANKLKRFIKQLSAIVPSEGSPASEAELDSLIGQAEDIFERVSNAKTSEVERSVRDTENKLNCGRQLCGDLSDLTSELAKAESELASVKQRLSTVLGEESLDSLATALERAEEQVEETALLHDLQKKASRYLERHLNDFEKQRCPVCEGEVEPGNCLGTLKSKIGIASARESEIVAERDALRIRYEEALHLNKQLGNLTEAALRSKEELHEVEAKILDLLGPDFQGEDIGTALQEYMEGLDGTRMTQEKRLREAMELHQEWKRTLDRFREEIRFHGIQERLLQFQKRERRLKEVEGVLKELTLFGDSVRMIAEALEDALKDTLRAALPGINGRLTDAFKGLTEHPAYNRVFIYEPDLPKLQLHIASDHAPFPGWPPSDVLNGQALNALELVPYFAFSELTDVPFEVYLVLLDDPTQSFDNHHIEILVSKLAELGKRVQLIVASHEVDHFSSFLSDHFDSKEYGVLRVSGFSSQQGPILGT